MAQTFALPCARCHDEKKKKAVKKRRNDDDCFLLSFEGADALAEHGEHTNKLAKYHHWVAAPLKPLSVYGAPFSVTSCLHLEKKRKKTTHCAGSESTPTSIDEKRIPRAEAPCIPFTKRNKKVSQWESGGLLAESPQ
eukprot:1154053-Pelagomonas_calceolata.AAC.1